jgi:hypothetical protein
MTHNALPDRQTTARLRQLIASTISVYKCSASMTVARPTNAGGRIVLEGTATALLGSRQVAEKYLGIGVGPLSRSGERSQLLADRLKEVLSR